MALVQLLNKDKEVFLYEKPYPIMVINNLIDSELFKKIKSEYLLNVNKQEKQSFRHEKLSLEEKPIDKYDSINILGGSHDQNSKYEITKIFSNTVYLNEFLKYFESENFYNFIWHNFYKLNIVKKSFFYRKPKLRQPDYRRSLLDHILYKNYYLNFKIARYPNNSGIGLHTDNNLKIMSFLFYLGFSDNKERSIGGTQFWDSGSVISSSEKTLKDQEIRSHHFLERDDFKLFKNIEPFQNRLVAFFRTENSWHSVAPIEGLEENVTRETLQVNFMKVTGHRGIASFLSKTLINFAKLFR